MGAKTIQLINENVHVESVRDDVETLVMDAQVIEDFLKSADPAKRGKEVEIKLIARLRKHFGNPKFTELGERLERIKERHEQGLLTSVEFLKQMLELAKEVVEAEKQADAFVKGLADEGSAKGRLGMLRSATAIYYGYEAYSMKGGLRRWADEGRALSPEGGQVADH